MGHYAIILINRIGAAEGKLIEVHKKYEIAETFEVKAKSKVEATEAEVARLKTTIKKVEADLASEKERRFEA